MMVVSELLRVALATTNLPRVAYGALPSRGVQGFSYSHMCAIMSSYGCRPRPKRKGTLHEKGFAYATSFHN